MPTIIIKDCICPQQWGGISCDNEIGISEMYWCHKNQLIDIIFAPTASGCCTKGEIAAFGLDVSLVPLPEELLQPIVFVNQDDDTGAMVEWSWSDEGGNKTRTYTATMQVVANGPDQDCSMDLAMGKEICLVYKGKDGKWRILNWDGGAKLQNLDGSTNQSYVVLVLTGRVNSRQLYVSHTDNNAWADLHLIPFSADPNTGLINL